MTEELPKGLIVGTDAQLRCFWCGDKEDYIHYHDTEWGQPVDDDFLLFQKICLEGFQAGLSWLTILRKRENFRKAFANFDFNKVAEFTEADIERLVQDKGIVRHRGKITSVINNAKRAQEIVEEFGSLAKYFWGHEPDQANRPDNFDFDTLMKLSSTEISKAMSRDLKKRGWSFVGPTTIYAFMQAMGMVNDHIEGCAFRETVDQARAAFQRP